MVSVVQAGLKGGLGDMLMIVLVVFLGVFSVLALLLFALGGGATESTRKTLANLEVALAASRADTRDEMVDIRKIDQMSALPWVNRWLMSMELAPKLRMLLSQANLKWTAGRLLLSSAICFMVPAFLVDIHTGTPGLALVMGLVGGFAPFGYVLRRRKKRLGRFEQGLPQALDMIVGALRAGQSLIAALGLAARESPDPIGSEFRMCFEEQNYGLELRTAMENLADRVPVQDLRIVVTAILIQKESGGNLAEVLEKTAGLIRDRFRLKQQVRVHTAQGRLTGMILTALPVLLGFALYFINPQTMSLLWTRPLGLKLLYTSVAMTIAGGLIIRKIVNMEV